ncbi:alanine--tRNA ligase-related protein, partial [Providencia rettgeri]
EQGFEHAMEDQRRRARESSGFGADYNSLIKVDKRSEFSGYQYDEQQATITALYKDGQPVDTLKEGEEGLVILDKTAFYAESGG